MKTGIRIYDTTLRDGAQSEEISFTLRDKLSIAERLDDFGIRYIEGGWPGSNPRDEAFFREVRGVRFKQARLAAFGSTQHAGTTAGRDRNLKMLLRAETPVVTIFGKTWDLHVRDDLRVPLSKNLDLIYDSIRYLARRTDEVIFDAEHFFDGHRYNPEYALRCVQAAAEAGASLICLCETNGGRIPREVTAGVEAVAAAVSTPVGIHCHNDSELAVANSLAAVECGAVQVQGTINGFGERCGNANLCSVIANLQLKMGYRVVNAAKLAGLRDLSHFVYELANLEPAKRLPYVGASAFAHKGGVHVAAVRRNPQTYEHIVPERVGNRRRVLVSDLSGRANIMYKAKQFGLDLDQAGPQVRSFVDEVKTLEHEGYQFEGADASLELRMRRSLFGETAYFRLIQFRVVDEKGYMRLVFDDGSVRVNADERMEHDPASAWATVMIAGPNGEIEHTAAEGNGPVNALDTALRRALCRFYPRIENVRLLDYKVRVLESGRGSSASVRVLIESGDGVDRWRTIGVSQNVIEASWQALVDSFVYRLHMDETGRGRKKGRGRPGVKGRRPAKRGRP